MTATAAEKMDDASRNAMAVVSALIDDTIPESVIDDIARDLAMSDPADVIVAFSGVAVSLLNTLQDTTGLPRAELWQHFTRLAAVTLSEKRDDHG